jgi:hypothetical protein
MRRFKLLLVAAVVSLSAAVAVTSRVAVSQGAKTRARGRPAP